MHKLVLQLLPSCGHAPCREHQLPVHRHARHVCDVVNNPIIAAYHHEQKESVLSLLVCTADHIWQVTAALPSQKRSLKLQAPFAISASALAREQNKEPLRCTYSLHRHTGIDRVRLQV